MRNRFIMLLSLVSFFGGFSQGQAFAGPGCLSDGCHHELIEVRYLHGPLAAEMAGNKGCEICHLPAGEKCTSTKAGIFRTTGKDICATCHGQVTGTWHAQVDVESRCLECHDPHGSETSPQMLRNSNK